MKIAHFNFMHEVTSGVINQLEYESASAEISTVSWKTFIYFSGFAGSKKLKTLKKLNYNGPLASLAHRAWFMLGIVKQQKFYDLILIRYDPYNPFLTFFLLFFKTKKIFLVHHSKEVEELKLEQGFKGFIKVFLEYVCGFINVRRSDGTVAVTHEIGKYESCRGNRDVYYIYPNGIDYSTSIVANDNRTNIPEFIFVASVFSPWQGLDKLIDAAALSKDEFLIHIIGRVSDVDLLKIQKDLRFKYHGPLGQDGICDISSSAWVGISSLALERQSLKEACALKVREYLAMGIPVYGGYKEVLPDYFIFYKNEEININSLLSYAREMRFVSRNAISVYSKKYIDKSILMNNFLSELVKNG